MLFFFCRYKKEREQASKLAASVNVSSLKSGRKRRSSSQEHSQSSGEESGDQQENDMFDDSFSQDEEMQIVDYPSSPQPMTPPNPRHFGTENRNYGNTKTSLALSTPTMVTPMGLSSVHNQRATHTTPKSSHASWMESPVGSRPPKPKRIWLEREQENRDDQYFNEQQQQQQHNCDNQPRPSVLVMASPSPTPESINETCRNRPEVDPPFATFYGVGASKSFHADENGPYAQLHGNNNHSYVIKKFENEVQEKRFSYNNSHNLIHLTATQII